MVSSFGQMEKHMREIGVLGKRTAMGFGNRQKGITTKANGNKIYKMGRDAIFIKDAPCTEDTLKIHSSKEEGKNNSKMEISTKASTQKGSPMDTANIAGLMGILTRVILSMGQDMAKGL